MNLKQRAAAFYKALTEVTHPGRQNFLWKAEKPSISRMKKDVGSGLEANVLMSPIGWLQRAAKEAPIELLNDKGEAIEKHPLLSVLKRPNDFYTWTHLLDATILSWFLDGNAYWLPQFNQMGVPVAFWYTPHWLIEPKWDDDGNEFITHYEYRPGRKIEKLKPEQVVHFRNGMNPDNIRKGLSPLVGLLQEIWTDMEASSFVGTIMANGGIPGLLFSPKGKGKINPQDVKIFKEFIETQFRGDNRGRPLVTSTEMRVEQFGYDPAQLDLSAVRNISEERVCAKLGIPAAVVGFGTGLQQTKVGATMKELRREAWFGGVLPMLTGLGEEMTRHLVPLFKSTQPMTVHFNISKVPALQEDKDKAEARSREALKVGAITQNSFLVETGREKVPGGDVYLRPFSVIEVPAGSLGRTIEGEVEKFGEGILLFKEEHTEFEQRMATESPHLDDPPKQLVALADRIDVIRALAAGAFEKDLVRFFDNLGKIAFRVAIEVLPADKAGEIETKDEATSRIRAAQILEGMAMDGELPIFAKLFEKHYFNVGQETAKAMTSLLGIEAGVPDPVARAILGTAGRRVGLVGLEKQTLTSIFNTMVQAEAEGIGTLATARRIRSAAGLTPRLSKAVDNFRSLLADDPAQALTRKLRDRRFDGTIRRAINSEIPLTGKQIDQMVARYTERAINYRANTIARTEMRYASNVSTLEMGKNMGATEALVFDARLGATDAICEMLNGAVVSMSDAEQLMGEEHPNGTRSFTPIPPGMEI